MDNVRVRVKRGCEGVIVIDFVVVSSFLMRPSTTKQALTGRYIIAQVVRPGYDMTSPSPACKVGT